MTTYAQLEGSSCGLYRSEMSFHSILAAAAMLCCFVGASQAQSPDDIEDLIDQLNSDIQPQLEMLGFIRSLVQFTSAVMPMCKDAAPGSWPDTWGEIRWTDKDFPMLQAGLSSCQADYERLHRFLVDQAPGQGALLARIVDYMDSEIARNLDEFVGDMVADSRGVSYSCGSMLKITGLCAEAARTD